MKKKALAFLNATLIVLIISGQKNPYKFAVVDGHKMQYQVAGTGKATVVFENGFSSTLNDWDNVFSDVAHFAKVVRYDRMGYGGSEPTDKPRTLKQIASELHDMLHEAKFDPPYVLVGHSFGGPFIRVFADIYPDDVAALILLDPTQEEFIDWNQAREAQQERQDAEWKDIRATLVQAHESRVPAGVPVTLITAMGPRVLPSFVSEQHRQDLRTLRPMWLEFHNQWMEKIPNSQHLITENSGHGIPFEEPQLVIKVIRQAVEQTRNHHASNKVR